MSVLYSQDTAVSENATRVLHPSLSNAAMEKLRIGLATCRSKTGLTPEAREAMIQLCAGAHRDGWTPEQLLVAVKEACRTSDEISHLTTTSERDAFLAKIITFCIQEFFKFDQADRPR